MEDGERQGEEGLGETCVHFFGNFEKEPLFPKPKQPFPCKRRNKGKFCANAQFIVLREGISPSTEENEPTPGPITTAAIIREHQSRARYCAVIYAKSQI